MTLLLLLASCFESETPPTVVTPPEAPKAPQSDPKIVTIGRRLDNDHLIGLRDDGSLVEVIDVVQQKLQPFGTVTADGSYQLVDGRSGNLFHSQDLTLSLPMQGMFSQRVQEFANKSSEIDQIHRQVSATGQGVHVGLLDANLKADQHEDRTVPAVVRDLAPGVEISRLKYAPSSPTMPTSLADKTIDGFNNFVVGMTINYLDQFMAQLQGLLKDPAAPRVVNVSNGLSFSMLSTTVFKMIPTGHPWRSLVTISEDPYQSVIDVSKVLETAVTKDERFKRKLAEYQSLTKKVADKGIVLVVACGNESLSYPGAPGAAFNILAMSDHVISVASSNSQETPGNFADDTMASSSAVGNERWQPTLAAPGEYIQVKNQTGATQVVSGTSFAAPYVAGAIALMLEVNKKLTFEQIKSLLVRSAMSLEGVDAKSAGAGILNVSQAVSLATQP